MLYSSLIQRYHLELREHLYNYRNSSPDFVQNANQATSVASFDRKVRNRSPGD
jgi:hypothetical protein